MNSEVVAPAILIVGAVPPSGIGDLLQYYVAIELLKKSIPDSDLTLFTPGGSSDLLRLLSNVQVVPGADEMSSPGYLMKKILEAVSVKATRAVPGLLSDQESPRHVGTFGIRGVLRRKYYDSSLGIRYLRPAIARVLFGGSFSAGVMSGHTIEASAFLNYVIGYFVSRAIVTGPMMTFPISVSRMGVRARVSKESLLERGLRCFDLVFVRGPYSFQLLSRYVERHRIRMAPDSGLGIRLLCGPIQPENHKDVTRIAIVPRKDYFWTYGKPELYMLYLRALARLVRSLLQGGRTELYLVPQTLDDPAHGGLDDVTATDDLVRCLGNEVASGRLKRFYPKSPVEVYRIFGSMDLVITSRMHGGITAMAAGTPALFLVPRDDVKVLDILSFLGLNSRELMIDIFDVDALTFENFAGRTSVLLHDIGRFRRMVTESVEKALPDVDLPARVLAKLLG